MLVVTKLDLTGSEAARERIAAELCRDILPISAVTGKGIPPLIHRIGALLDQLPAPGETPVVLKPRPTPVPVEEPEPVAAGVDSGEGP